MNPFNPTARRPLARTTPLLLAGLLLTACATAPETTAPQAAAPQAATAPQVAPQAAVTVPQAATAPQWDPAQVAAPQLPKITTPQQVQVRDRATARWQTLMAGDFAKAYAFTTPTFRKSTTEAAYLVQFEKKPQWHSAEVLTVTCATPASCVARVRMDLKVSMPRTKMDRITTHGDEAWLLEDGQWWLSDDTPR